MSVKVRHKIFAGATSSLRRIFTTRKLNNSVLPDPAKYPCYDGKNDYIVKDKDGTRRIKSMLEQRIDDDLDQIVRGAEILINKEWDFDRCMRDHLRRMKQYYPVKIWSFDDLHKKYLVEQQ